MPTITAPVSVPWVSGGTTLGLSAVWRCVNLIADSISDMPWREWTGPDQAPTLHKEPLTFEYVHLTQRSYK